MKEETLMEIGKINVTATYWDSSLPDELNFEWVEPSNYCLYPDELVEVSITKETAVELVAVLTKHFKL